MEIFEVVKRGLTQDQRQGNNNFAMLLIVVAAMSMWGGFNLLSKNDEKLARQLQSNQQAIQKLQVRTAVLSSQHESE